LFFAETILLIGGTGIPGKEKVKMKADFKNSQELNSAHRVGFVPTQQYY
jgi:hypothetical protein